MEFTVDHRFHGDVTIVTVTGEIDVFTTPQLRETRPCGRGRPAPCTDRGLMAGGGMEPPALIAPRNRAPGAPGPSAESEVNLHWLL